MAGTVNKQALAELQGVSLPTITKWIADGMPFKAKGGRGQGWEFDNAEVTEWRITQARKEGRATSQEESESAAKRRKMSAEADIAEMNASERRGELVVAADMLKAFQNDAFKVRAKLLSLPNRAAPMVVGVSEIKARDYLDTLIYEALNELATITPDEAEAEFKMAHKPRFVPTTEDLQRGRYFAPRKEVRLQFESVDANP